MGRKSAVPADAPPLQGLRFAVYARKSTEDARTEDHKSTARQVEQATRYVETRGGTVLPDQVYLDEDASGAEFMNRPGLLRLLNAVGNGRPFSALVMMEGSRLGREQIETQYTLKQITDAGVKVFYYLTDEEARLDTVLDKVMSTLRLFAAEVVRDRARQRCRDAAERKARHGHVAGGVVIGYENVRMKSDRPALPGEAHDYVARRIHPEQAAIVRGIFRMYADGWGTLQVTKCLNGHPDLAAQRQEFFDGRTCLSPFKPAGGWNAMTVRCILSRPLYKGQIVWGKTQKIDRDGRAGIAIPRASAEWVTQEAEALRIIDEPL